MRFDPLGNVSVSAHATSRTTHSFNTRRRLAAICLAASLIVSGGTVATTRLYAQETTATASNADSDLLKQGVSQWKADQYEEAQVTLSQVKSDNLSESERETLAKTLAKVQDAANQRKAARAEFQQGEESLAANRLSEAAGHYKAAASNDRADQGTVAKAKEQLQLVAAKQKAVADEQTALYNAAKQDLADGKLADAKTKFQTLKDAGFKAGWFQKNPAEYIETIDKKFAEPAPVPAAPETPAAPAAPVAPAAPAVETPAAPAGPTAREFYQAGKDALKKKEWAAARENLTKAREAGYKAGLFEDSADKLLGRVDQGEKEEAAAKVALQEKAEQDKIAAEKATADKAAAEKLAAEKAKTDADAAAKAKEAADAYAQGVTLFGQGDLAGARTQFAKAGELGYKAGLFETSPASYLSRIDKKEQAIAADKVAAEKAAVDKAAADKAAAEQAVADKAAADKAAAEKAVADKAAADKAAAEKAAAEKVAAEKAAAEKVAQETKPAAPTPEAPAVAPAAPPQVTASSAADKALQDTAALEQIAKQQKAFESSRKVEQAVAAQQKSDYSTALQLYTDALTIDPSNQAAVAGKNRMLELTGTAALPSPLIERTEKIVRARKEAIRYSFDTAVGKAQNSMQGPAYDFKTAQTAIEEAKVARDTDPAIFTQDEIRQMNSTLANTSLALEQTREAKVKLDKETADSSTRTAESKRLREESEAKERTVRELIKTARRLIDENRYNQALGVVDQIIAIDPSNDYAVGVRPWLQDKDNFAQQRLSLETFDQQLTKQLNSIDEKMIPYDDILRYPANWPDLTEMREQSVQQERGIRQEDQAVLAQLDRRLPEVRFDNVGFSDVVDFLRDITGTNIFVNWKALEGAGIDKNAPVTARLRDVKFSKALTTILSVLGGGAGNAKLGYTVDEGVVTISTEDDLGKNLVTRVYDIRDLIIQVPDFDNAPEFSLTQATQSQAGGGGGGGGGGGSLFGGAGGGKDDKGLTRKELVDEIIKLITETIAPDSWKDAGGKGGVRELSGQLIVSQTPEVHRQLANLLSQLRETRALQVQIETRFLYVTRNFMEDIGVNANFSFNTQAPNNWSQVNVTHYPEPAGTGDMSKFNTGFTALPKAGGPGDIGSAIGTYQAGNLSPLTASVAYMMDDWQASFLIRAVQASRYTTQLTAPRITLFNGQRAYVLVATQQAYVSDLTPIVGARSVAFQPEIGTIQTGVVLDVSATVSSDRRYVTLTLRPQLASIQALVPFDTDLAPGVHGTIQLPTLNITDIRTTVSVPDGGTILLGGQTLGGEIELEDGVPVLSKIPFLKRLFTNRSDAKNEQILLILVKPTIVIQREVESKAFPLLSGRVNN